MPQACWCTLSLHYGAATTERSAHRTCDAVAASTPAMQLVAVVGLPAATSRAPPAGGGHACFVPPCRFAYRAAASSARVSFAHNNCDLSWRAARSRNARYARFTQHHASLLAPGSVSAVCTQAVLLSLHPRVLCLGLPTIFPLPSEPSAPMHQVVPHIVTCCIVPNRRARTALAPRRGWRLVLQVDVLGFRPEA